MQERAHRRRRRLHLQVRQHVRVGVRGNLDPRSVNGYEFDGSTQFKYVTSWRRCEPCAAEATPVLRAARRCQRRYE